MVYFYSSDFFTFKKKNLILLQIVLSVKCLKLRKTTDNFDLEGCLMCYDSPKQASGTEKKHLKKIKIISDNNKIIYKIYLV